MNPCSYSRTIDVSQAIESVTGNPGAAFLAGGTTLIDLMKEGVMRPTDLVDVNGLPWNKVERLPNGGVMIGSMVKNSDLAWDPIIAQNYPVLSQALLSGASAQLRNMASTGGNLMQRTRCYYFRDAAFACNKREPGSGCSALHGYNRAHAILGVSDQCIATHPSDMCVALSALEATLHLVSAQGERTVAFDDFYRLPGNTPDKETILQHGELIRAVELPPLSWARNSHYLKVRDRASYEFALVSVAALLDTSGGQIRAARIALGGVATKPWRVKAAEMALVGKAAQDSTYQAAAELAVEGAQPGEHNAFKVEMVKRAVVRALQTVGGGSKV